MIRDSTLQAQLLELLATTIEGITPQEVCQQFSRKLGADRKQTRRVLRAMLDTGKIQYATLHGRTIIFPSLQGPLRVSERIVLLPSGQHKVENPQEIAVFLSPGSAFGLGDHPTTCLSLRLLEKAFNKPGFLKGAHVLDIGTGTGVLLIAALKMGAARGVGLDIDPCARQETLENLRINGVAERAEVLETPLEDLEGTFGLVTANLRPPSLSRVFEVSRHWISEPGILLVSGFRPEEAEAVRQSGCRHHFQEEAYLMDRGWAAIFFLYEP